MLRQFRRGRLEVVIAVALVTGLLAAASTPSSAGNSEGEAGGSSPGAIAGPLPTIAPSRPGTALEPEPGRGFVPPAFDLPETEAPMLFGALPLAGRFDWRESGDVTSVKDQGACGACYAFAVAGNIESKLLIEDEDAFDFSENNLKECDYYGSSCGGGNYWREANLLSTEGTVLETCDPYVPSNVACKTTCSNQVALLDWRELSRETVPTTETIKTYLQTYGPMYTAMNAGHGDAWAIEFNNYDGSYTLYTTATGSSNHAVLLVGWDDDLVHAGGQGAWIVKNSWGTSWGGTCGYGSERGYFTVAYGSANVGSWSSFIADWQYHDPDGTLLYYDEAGYTSAVGYGTTTAWGLCKYIPSEDVILQRVEFWSADANTDVDIYVYDTFSGGTLSGLLTSTLNSTFPLSGYHSIAIPASPRVTAENDIYVVAKLTDASYNFPLIYDSAGPKSSASSYISYNGSSWSEWTAGDLGLRLRVTEDGSCGTVIDEPVLASVDDVPSDNGGHVRLTWARSIHDAESASPQVKRYKIWRRRAPVEDDLLRGSEAGEESAVPATPRGPYEHGETGAVWELAGVVPATGECNYSLTVHTQCDSTPGDPCWTKFFVAAHTGTIGEHFDSPVDSGYSVDNLFAYGAEADSVGPTPFGPDEGAIGQTSLKPPEPNPAADSFIIRYDLAIPGWLSLEVYDIAGRRLVTLAEGYTDRGRYVAGWDGTLADKSPAAPGIYFVRLLTGGEAQTAKLVLVR